MNYSTKVSHLVSSQLLANLSNRRISCLGIKSQSRRKTIHQLHLEKIFTKFLSIIILCIILSSTSHTQVWTNQNSGTSYTLSGVHFLDVNNGWIVGFGLNGTNLESVILKTTNSGISWTSQFLVSPNQLAKVFFFNANIGWACGSAGTILKTTNGGINWAAHIIQGANTILDIFFIDMNNGWAVAGSTTIYKTTNGGINWSSHSTGYNSNMFCVTFKDINNGVAAGSAYNNAPLIRTTNGGISWIWVSNGPAENFYEITYLDANKLIVVGNMGAIAKSTDGGINWSLQSSGIYEWLQSVSFVNANYGWVSGAEGMILRTTNGGTVWTTQTSGTFAFLNGVYFVDANNGWVVGSDGVILKYSDTLPVITLNSPNGGENLIAGNSHNIAWTSSNVTNVKIEYTTNNGSSWTTIASSTPSDGNYLWTIPNTPSTQCKVRISDVTNPSFNSTSFSTFSIIVLNNQVHYSRIEFYTNVGTNSDNPNNYLNSGRHIRFRIKIKNELTTNILTAFGTIQCLTPGIIVTDNQATYNNVLSGNSAWSVDDYEIYVPPSKPFGTRIAFTLNITQAVPPTGPWTSDFDFSIAPIRVGEIYLDDDLNPDSWGNNNKVPEPGETIEVIPLLKNISLDTIYSVSGKLTENLDGITVWNNVLGVSGMVYDTWRYNLISGISQPILPGNTGIQPEQDYVFDYSNISPYNSLLFNLDYSAYFEGNPGPTWDADGILIKWENPFYMGNGIVSSLGEMVSSDFIPSEIQLYQNYPNPFNPSTRIKFQIPNRVLITLKIFDVLGNEVGVLVDREMESGSYEIEFDASEIPTGVYFYQLRAGDVIQTKKMILMK